MRLHYYLGVILEDENEVQECFRIIQSEVLEATIKSLAYNEQARIVTDHHNSQTAAPCELGEVAGVIRRPIVMKRAGLY